MELPDDGRAAYEGHPALVTHATREEAYDPDDGVGQVRDQHQPGQRQDHRCRSGSGRGRRGPPAASPSRTPARPPGSEIDGGGGDAVVLAASDEDEDNEG